MLGRRTFRVCYDRFVPIISTFFGIIIRMFFDDHEPRHFHAEHQGQTATLTSPVDSWSEVSVPEQLVGSSASAARAQQSELEENWKRAQKLQPLNQVAPL